MSVNLSICVLFLLAPCLSAASETASAIIRGTDTFEFSYVMTIPEIDGKGRLWLPIASSDNFQAVELLGVTTHKAWTQTRDKDYGNPAQLDGL